MSAPVGHTTGTIAYATVANITADMVKNEELAQALEQLEMAANDWARAVSHGTHRDKPSQWTESPEATLRIAVRGLKLARGKQ